MRLRVHPSDPVNDVLVNLASEFERYNLDAGVLHDCQVIIDEIYANLKAHVLPDNPGLTWNLSVYPEQDHVMLVVEYPGPFFDPTRPMPVRHQPLAVRQEGGMGLYLVTRLSDDIQHGYHRGVNTLTIRKDITTHSEGQSLCR